MPVEITPNGFRIQRKDDGIWFQEPTRGAWYGPKDDLYYYDSENDALYNRKYSFWAGLGEMYLDLARYDTTLLQWMPVGYVYDTEGYWNKPDHVFLKGKYWHIDDPNKPRKELWFKDVNLILRESSLGCGTKQLYNFYFDASDEAIVDMFNRELDQYCQARTGIILAVLNPAQNPTYGPILLAAGFELLSEHTNYMHNHPNYLYGFKCMNHKAVINEKGRAFG
jgi:hypothetical protein